jgi:hypothetical protein
MVHSEVLGCISSELNEKYNRNYFNTNEMSEKPALVSLPRKVKGTDNILLSSIDRIKSINPVHAPMDFFNF